MKIFRTILALLLVVVLGTMTVACLDDGKQQSDDGNGNPQQTTAPVESTGDRDAIAITLGNMSFTAGEVEDSFNSYVAYMAQYGMAAPSTDAQIAEALDIVIEDLVSSNAILWQAELKGITLTDEEEAGVVATVEAQRQELISLYREDVSANATETMSDEELETATMEALESDVMSYSGLTFDGYMDMMLKYSLEDAIMQKVYQDFEQAYSVSDADVEQWYNTNLETQTSACESDPLTYRTQYLANINDPTVAPALFTPEGYLRVQLIEIKPEGTLEESYTTNKSDMEKLEAEYGKLLLNGENPERQADIVSEYATLKNAVDATWTLHIQAAKTAAEAAYAQINAGEDFVSVMKEYSTAAEDEEMQKNGALLYKNAADSSFNTVVWNAAITLPVGSNSSILEVDGTFYIVKVLGEEPAGAMDFEANKDAISAAARAELVSSAWSAQSTAWTEEAMNIKVLNPEAYAYIGR